MNETRQIKWQNDRNDVYSLLMHHARNLSREQRYLGALPYSPTRETHTSHADMQFAQLQDAQDVYYDQIVPLDTAIKNARREQDWDALDKLLTQGERLIENLRQYL